MGCRYHPEVALVAKCVFGDPVKAQAAALPQTDLCLADMFFSCIKITAITWM